MVAHLAVLARMPRRLAGWLLPLLLVGARAAAQPAPPALPPGAHHYGLEAGLPQRRVTALWPAPDGWLWVGTDQGLHRFDGVRFTPAGPRAQGVLALTGDSARLCATRKNGGLWLLDTRTGARRVVPRPDSLGTTPGHQVVYAALLTRRGALYLGTEAGWLLRERAPGRFGRVARIPPPALHAPTVSWVIGLSEDAAGDLWISTAHDGGVYRYQPATNQVRRYPDTGLPADPHRRERNARVAANPVTAAVVASWADSPLLRYDRAADTFGPQPLLLPPGPASRYWAPYLLLDAHNRAWGGPFFETLYRFPIPTDPADPPAAPRDFSSLLRRIGATVTGLAADATGGLWVGTTNGLLHVSEPSARFDTLLTRSTNVPAAQRYSLRGLAELPDGRLLLSGYRGLHLIDPRRAGVQPLADANAAAPDDPTPIQAYAARPDSGGRGAWVVGEGMGLRWFRLGAGPQLPPDRLPALDRAGRPFSRHLRALLPDGRGGFWLGSYNGVLRYTPSAAPGKAGVIDHQSAARAPALGLLDCFALEKVGAELWAAGQEGLFGLDFRTGALRWTLPPGTLPLPVRVVCPDPAGAGVWLGTAGVVLLDARTHRVLRRLDVADGLSHPMVNAIVPDRAGHLWISTDDGLNRYTPATGQVRVFRAEDGLSAAEFNHGSGLRLRSGELLFGSVNGLTRVRAAPPASAGTPSARSARPTSLLLTALRWYDGAARQVRAQRFGLRADQLLTLGPRDEFFALSLALPHPDDPTRHRFRYRLAGLETNWSTATGAPTIRYPRLPPGAYALWVRAAAADGRWLPAARVLRVQVLAPVYARWWFLTLAALAVAAAVALAWRWRENRVRQLERLRLRLAADLHDDVGSLLTQISLESTMLREGTFGPDQQRARLTRVVDASQSAIRQMGDVVWSIAPGHDSGADLLDRLRDHAHELLPPAGLDIDFRADPAIGALTLPLAVRQNLYLIFKEALHNVVKHAADATLVSIHLSRAGRYLRLSVTDDGAGPPPGAPPGRPGGHGLANMRRRAQASGGDVQYETPPGGGFGVVATVRL